MKKYIFLLFLCADFVCQLHAQCTDTHGSGGNPATSTTSFGQSFQPSCSGKLNTIAVIGDANTSGHAVTLYQGIGTGGTVLGVVSSQSIIDEDLSLTDFSKSVFSFSSQNINLTMGSDYTFMITGIMRLFFHNTNTYPNGQLYFDGGAQSAFDLNFEVDYGTTFPVTWSVQPSAKKYGSSTRISFSIAQQINNSRFEIEHSQDARRYQLIGIIEGEGNTSQEKDYEFDHKTPNNGHNYYRVKQVDFDGQHSYSKVTSVNYKADRPSIYPNPVADNLTVSSPTEDRLVIYNHLGQQMKSQTLKNGTNIVDMSELRSNIYFIRFGNGAVERIVKK